MGNRAVLLFQKSPEIGIYLHWNGGVESVLAFLQATRETVGTRGDPVVGVLHTVSNFFRYDGLHVYIGAPDTLDCDNGDNGTFVVDAELNIIKREHVPSHFAGFVYYAFDDLDEKGKDYHQNILRDCLANRVALEELQKKRAV